MNIRKLTAILLVLFFSVTSYANFCITNDEFLMNNKLLIDEDSGKANINDDEHNCLKKFNLDFRSSSHADWQAVVAPIRIPSPDASSFKQMECKLKAAFKTCIPDDIILTDVSCYDDLSQKLSKEILDQIKCPDVKLM